MCNFQLCSYNDLLHFIAADVRRLLRKREDTIPFVVALLAAEGKYNVWGLEHFQINRFGLLLWQPSVNVYFITEQSELSTILYSRDLFLSCELTRL